MINYVPKVMIYRVGKYTPYKGVNQEIEMMLKFINMEETPLWFRLKEYEDISFGANPQEEEVGKDEHKELTHSCKVKEVQRVNCLIDLPKDKVMLDLKNLIDKNAQGTLISENAVDKRSKEELLEYVENKEDVVHMYKVIGNNAIMKFPVYITKKFNIEQDDVKFAFNIVLTQKRS